jgi:spermidine synthase
LSRRATYVAVFLVAAATLVLEILLTRITSVVAWYHLAFFVISLAMLGMTAGAVIVFVRPAAFPDARIGERMSQAAVAFAVTMPLAMMLALAIPLRPITDLGGFMAMLGFGGLLALPFAVGGIVLTLALTRAGLPEGRVYGVDLCGAAAGCALVVPLLAFVDAPSAVFVAAAAAAISGWAFARGAGLPAGPRRIALVVAAVLLAAAGWNATSGGTLLRPRWIKGFPELPERYLYSGWNTYSRVTVDHELELPPSFWSPSRALPQEWWRLFVQRGILIDGAAGTSMARFDVDTTDGEPGQLADHGYLAWDLTSFAHGLRPHGPAAVIGVGGGRDVLEAARVGHAPVVGIELNGLIVALHRKTMRDFSGIADLPEVELVEDEARSYLARDHRRYSVITMSLIDTWAATGAGAYSLSENGLYTVEGWRIFLQRLEDNGIFTVSRWYKPDSPGETARMLALAYQTLWSIGAERPRAHVILLQNLNIATVLISPKPFSKADLDAMQKLAVERGFNMMLTPRKLPSNPLLRELAELPNPEALASWADQQLFDLSAPTDARPFFFNMLRPSTWFSPPEAVDELDLAFLGNLHATQTLVFATLASLLLTLVAIAVPLFLRRAPLRGYARGELFAACGYFGLIGLGFMFVEMGLLSRLNVFLGHPTLALAVLLGGLILFTGLGSLASARVPIDRPAVARRFPLLPAACIVLAGAAVDPVMSSLSGAGTALRIFVAIALVAVPALGMGLGFPLGLRLVERIREPSQPPLGPWMWGINGACGVVASGLALTCSMAWGIATTLGVGASCYLALLACTAKLARSARA